MTHSWFPTATDHAGRYRLEVGDIVAYAHAAWLVDHVLDAVPNPDEETHLAHYVSRRRERVPYSATLRRLHGPAHPRERARDPGVLAVRVSPLRPPLWRTYPGGRVPLCSCCGHPWPCRAREAEQESTETATRLEELAQRVAAGACFGCGEPITTRQAAITYREGNAQVPLAGGPSFHARLACREQVVAYERRRAAVYPDAAPIVDVRTYAVLRDNDGRALTHAEDSYHAAFLRAVAEDGIDPARSPRRSGPDSGRRDKWRAPAGAARRRCRCGQGPVTHVGGVRAVSVTSGCRACVTAWVQRTGAPTRA